MGGVYLYKYKQDLLLKISKYFEQKYSFKNHTYIIGPFVLSVECSGLEW